MPAGDFHAPLPASLVRSGNAVRGAETLRADSRRMARAYGAWRDRRAGQRRTFYVSLYLRILRLSLWRHIMVTGEWEEKEKAVCT